MSAQAPQAQILGFGSLKFFIFFPLPFDTCRFYRADPHKQKRPTSDAFEATAVELFLVGGQQKLWLEGDEAKAFVEWYLTISGERRVEPVGPGLHLA